MLPRSRRLRRSSDIRRVVSAGHRFVTPFFTAYYINGGSETAKATVIVGKAVHKSAVRRHRYQRWLRALVRQIQLRLPHGQELVIVGRPHLATITTQAELLPYWQEFVNWHQSRS